MATERLLMRHIREILRLKWTLRRSHRDTARSLGISAGAVASVVTRAKAIGLTWDTVSALSDDALERTLYGPKLALTVARPGPDLVWMHTELRRPGLILFATSIGVTPASNSLTDPSGKVILIIRFVFRKRKYKNSKNTHNIYSLRFRFFFFSELIPAIHCNLLCRTPPQKDFRCYRG